MYVFLIKLNLIFIMGRLTQTLWCSLYEHHEIFSFFFFIISSYVPFLISGLYTWFVFNIQFNKNSRCFQILCFQNFMLFLFFSTQSMSTWIKKYVIRNHIVHTVKRQLIRRNRHSICIALFDTSISTSYTFD